MFQMANKPRKNVYTIVAVFLFVVVVLASALYFGGLDYLLSSTEQPSDTNQTEPGGTEEPGYVPPLKEDKFPEPTGVPPLDEDKFPEPTGVPPL
jgi:uncharacterized membrane protein SpoIIM required for sporulation